MNSLTTKTDSLSLDLPNNAIGPAEVEAALHGLKITLDSAVEIFRVNAEEKTQRTAIMAKKEIGIAAIEADTRRYLADIQRGMENDRLNHAEKMELIKTICDISRQCASQFQPETLSLIKALLEAIK